MLCLGFNDNVNDFRPLVACQQMCGLSLCTLHNVPGDGRLCGRNELLCRVCAQPHLFSRTFIMLVWPRLKGPAYESGTRLQAASGLHHLMSNHFVILVCCELLSVRRTRC